MILQQLIKYFLISMKYLDRLLFAKQDLETLDPKDIVLLIEYFNIPVTYKDDRYWLLALNIHSTQSSRMPS